MGRSPFKACQQREKRVRFGAEAERKDERTENKKEDIKQKWRSFVLHLEL